MVTLEVVPRGKHLLHRLDSGLTLHSHLRMEGSWRVRPTASMTPRTVRGTAIRALLATDTWTAVGKRLGMLDLLDTRDESRIVGHLGPDLLGADWDAHEAAARLRAQPDAVPVGSAVARTTPPTLPLRPPGDRPPEAP